MQPNNFTTSVIVTTYNWPNALEKVLQALLQQQNQNFEIIIADDGSSIETKVVIDRLQSQTKLPILHVWQPDEGFQAARIRNKAAVLAKGDYLIFLDGDCIPLNSFVHRHLKFAEPCWFVAGNRILLKKEVTNSILEKEWLAYQWNLIAWLRLRLLQKCNRLHPLLFLPFMPRKLSPSQWQGAKSCNLALWRKDFYAVNGFDETFKGWGYEDSDLIVRLIKNGVKKKNGHFAIPVLHLWHEKEIEMTLHDENLRRLQTRLKDGCIQATLGINQYILESNDI